MTAAASTKRDSKNSRSGPRSAAVGAGGAPEDAPEATAEAEVGPTDTTEVAMSVSILDSEKPPMATTVTLA
jgi:hypothetical protein